MIRFIWWQSLFFHALTAAVNWITSSSTVAHSWKMDVQHGYKSRLSSGKCKKSFRLWLDEVQGFAPFTCCFPCWGVATWTRHIFVRKKYVIRSSDYTIFGSGKKVTSHHLVSILIPSKYTGQVSDGLSGNLRKPAAEVSSRFPAGFQSKLCNQVRSLDHFVVQNSGDFLCWKYKEVVCFSVSNLRQ